MYEYTFAFAGNNVEVPNQVEDLHDGLRSRVGAAAIIWARFDERVYESVATTQFTLIQRSYYPYIRTLGPLSHYCVAHAQQEYLGTASNVGFATAKELMVW